MKGWHAAERPEHGGLPHFRTLFLFALILISSSFAVSCSPLLWPEDDSIGKTHLEVTVHNGYEQHNSQAVLSIQPMKIITTTGSVGETNALVILAGDTLLFDMFNSIVPSGYIWYSDSWVTSRDKYDLAVRCENGTAIYSPIYGFDPPEFTMQFDDTALVFPGEHDTLQFKLPVELSVQDFHSFPYLNVVLWKDSEVEFVSSVRDSSSSLTGLEAADYDSLSFHAIRTKYYVPTTRSDGFDGLDTQISYFYNAGYPVKFIFTED